MEAIVFMVMAVLGAGMGVAIATYYVSHNTLVKVHAVEPESISLLLSLCSFGIVIAVAYFTLLDNIISSW